MKDMSSKHSATNQVHPTFASHRRSQRPRTRRHDVVAASTAFLAIGALVAGNALMVQSANAQQDSITETAAIAASSGRHSEQLDYYAERGDAITRNSASVALTAAHEVIAASESKVDASALASVASSLASFKVLPIDLLEDLTKETKSQTKVVAAATAEVDRIAAEAAAAAQAQAAAEAAAQAAVQAAAQAAAESARVQSLAGGNSVDGARGTARDMAASQYGWGEDQFSCLDRLWQKESGWNFAALNSSSGATGIPQALPGNKMASAGSDWASNATTQIRWGLGYIKASSYGTPCAAWSHSQAVGWY